AWMSSAESITSTDLQAHLEFIASDALEGRDTPSRGLDLAGMYLVSHLKRLGLKPGGENGTYYQTLTVRTDIIKTESSVVCVGEREFRYGEGFVARATPLSVTGQPVYVGHGWTNHAQSIDPYKGLDVRDKVLVVLSGFPRPVAQLGLERAQAEGWISPEENARRRGAKAILRIDPAFMERLDRQSRMWARRRIVEELERDETGFPVLTPSYALLDALCQGEEVSAAELIQRAQSGEAGEPFTFRASKRLQIEIAVETTREQAHNVIAIAEGRDPTLKNEYVAVGAHLDHVGKGTPSQPGEDVIFNGADDDGSGCVALLEMAEALAQGARPKRSVLFIWHVGEERGLWGSRLFTEKPTVPLQNIIAQVNLDMIGRSKLPGDQNRRNADLSEPDEIYVIGPKLASPDLGRTLEQVNTQYLRLRLNPRYDDPNDPERLYYRSDHYSYARKGIPVIFFFSGLHEDYHRPSDHVDPIDCEQRVKVTRTVFGLVWTLAEQVERPARLKPAQ
ncbi:MAG: M20/M25/M40 family metallo-hydrolase, partial [Fimbriimonadales bacterium]|nr:M20/M25/M40 family metallo-hydrolase [Fimbriimonadales bacterium]